MSEPDLIGRYTIERPSFSRQIAIDAFAALPESHPMVAMLELDASRALAAISRRQAAGEQVSLFAFVIHCIATALAEHPALNAVMHGRSVVRFDDVDISVPVEVETDGERVPREVVVRRAQDASPLQVYQQLTQARGAQRTQGTLGREDSFNRRLGRLARWVPRPLRLWLLRRFISDAFRVKRLAGTTLVTSVGKFAAMPGHAFTFTTGPRAAMFVVGGAVERPWVHEGQLVVRQVLSLSVMVNHDLVDGAPMARFATRLQALVESAHGLEA
ncbi:MAG: 2-oxo acid dehydrogenase subunit E2 [Myxococcaceae bacterium]|nr:2-oxo acid dehydrogenase subunit E2 [Myxococcaceae bacterium]